MLTLSIMHKLNISWFFPCFVEMNGEPHNTLYEDALVVHHSKIKERFVALCKQQ
jgi:hypothetical protein